MGWITGKKQTKEHREKISRALKGKKNAKGAIRSDAFKKNLKKYWIAHVHPTYKGESASYGGKHKRLHRRYGRADRCENPKCKKISQVYEWANISGQHKNIRSDWILLCRSCHRLFDFTPEKGQKHSKKMKDYWKKNSKLKIRYARLARKQYPMRKKNSKGRFV